ncbi:MULTISPECIES: hypothetical protein [Streptomyces diastaticus group]|uniref:Uncharacterized protein n=1 Tax=Streptomyces gougerotii TaxID=53448 RepID=A0A8H9LW72_9ACTN|nr:hypothetical protein [Streptomyces gougerotii]GFH80486.1 hypothetical protein Sgou_51560 [Streptomyces gougerotii]GGU88504.1 hypothetical protein GCM10010227_49020 [Streptomyces gougerotii]
MVAHRATRRVGVLLAEIGVSYAAAKFQLARCLHHTILDAHYDLAAGIADLRELALSGGYAHYVGIAHFMAGLQIPEQAPTSTELDQALAWKGWTRCWSPLARCWSGRPSSTTTAAA